MLVRLTSDASEAQDLPDIDRLFRLGGRRAAHESRARALGRHSNLFHQAFAQKTDPAIVTATVAHPRVVLRKPVGTNGAFERATSD
jgi:hypothetical protein